ncbi:type II toxin-antitoxin system PemK/MazF family toxin [Microbacterium invictum]|uniref:Type II toxin-antitoxin system PemK/MazF family toxin n=1 Tax=Microbacterium invictum TaxID=515415 RepID=A0ABZ0VAD0_9MICO|nr:type II toxin-antitoxin system PemK/MazF family toxin [Microbacterium invictum]WQB69767.1 type II toxin-antitoxin system PemK/MazF family toxin [Microbacterium invictum]
MIRGEIWTVAGGVYASKPTPALIVQDDAYAATDSVTVLPLTSRLVDAPLLRIRISAGGLSGLDRDGDVMVDKATTVRRSNVVTRVGRMTAEQLADVKRSVMAFLGLARRGRRRGVGGARSVRWETTVRSGGVVEAGIRARSVPA